MKCIADRMVFVNGSRVAPGVVFELPDSFRLGKGVRKVEPDTPTGDPGTPNVNRRKRKADPQDGPATLGEITKNDAAALALPDDQPSP